MKKNWNYFLLVTSNSRNGRHIWNQHYTGGFSGDEIQFLRRLIREGSPERILVVVET